MNECIKHTNLNVPQSLLFHFHFVFTSFCMFSFLSGEKEIMIKLSVVVS